MKDKTTKLLTASLVVVIALCIGVFSHLAVTMNEKNSETISQVGTIYMASMSEKISEQFETIMKLRLSQLEGILKTDPPGELTYGEALLQELQEDGIVRGFEYLAFYSEDGVFEMIYGDPIEMVNTAPFLNSLGNGEQKISVALTADGEKVLVLGVPAAYPMSDGQNSLALVAGLPVSYITETLSLDKEGAVVYSHIIRRDGSFVIRSADAYRNNYFTRIREIFEELNGKNAEQYVTELQTAMANNEDYTSVLLIGEERRHLYCTPLPNTEWYLVTVMPYGILDETVSQLSADWRVTVFGSCTVILLALLIVFALYYHLTRQQIAELNLARKKAVQASVAKSEFLSNMSHDIRTPMNAIVGMTAIASANIHNTKQVQDCLKKITLSSKHLLGLINDVLDMSKIESGKLTLNVEQISLREIVESIVNIVQPQVKAKHQHFDVFITNIETENVYCDSVRLNQVLLNFLSNAIKFTPEGGTIHVALQQEPSPLGDDYVRTHFWVKDNGIGMSEEFQQRIFEAFVREDTSRVQKTEGTGLGMAITKYIVDAMGGTIELQSELNGGSQFHVILDLERVVVQEEEMILPDWNMLVVDDDEQLCQTAVTSLQEIGVNAEWALSGERAICMVEERHQKQEDYHIILLDWQMPDMDGIATAREIRKRMGDEIPILLISAYDWSDIEAEARAAGVNGFIAKPLFKSTLFHSLRPYSQETGAGESSAEKTVTFAGNRILLAEDNDLNWEIANELLSDLGLELEWAENGKICVEKFAQSPVGYYAAILMDIRMPVMTGYEAADAVRALDRPDSQLPIIAMTADAFSEDIQRCLEHGMNAHVAKPIDVGAISRLLEKYLKD